MHGRTTVKLLALTAALVGASALHMPHQQPTGVLSFHF
jgi:hypothetical protein